MVIAVFDAGVEATRTLFVVSTFVAALPSPFTENVAAEIVSVSGIAEVSKRAKYLVI